MKYIMNPPEGWQLDLICYRGDFFCNSKGAIVFWDEFGLLITEFEMGCF